MSENGANGLVGMEPDALVYFLYISSADSNLSFEDLAEILRSSKEYNDKHGVTGMLLFKSGTFLQVLEATREEMGEVLDRILSDTRHRNIIAILSGVLEKRNFPDWSMGFVNMEEAVDSDVSYEDYFDATIELSEIAQDAEKAFRFIQRFNDWNP